MGLFVGSTLLFLTPRSGDCKFLPSVVCVISSSDFVAQDGLLFLRVAGNVCCYISLLGLLLSHVMSCVCVTFGGCYNSFGNRFGHDRAKTDSGFGFPCLNCDS